MQLVLSFFFRSERKKENGQKNERKDNHHFMNRRLAEMGMLIDDHIQLKQQNMKGIAPKRL